MYLIMRHGEGSFALVAVATGAMAMPVHGDDYFRYIFEAAKGTPLRCH